MIPCLALVALPRRLDVAFSLPLRVLVRAVKMGGICEACHLGWVGH